MSFNEIKDIVTIIGVMLASLSLAFTALNTRLSVKVNRARFWLDLRNMFHRHDEVHRRLRPHGLWTGGKGPETLEDWAMAEAYMGLFEHCEIMLKEGLIDERTFNDIYFYRLENIIANDTIRRKKLRDRAKYWKHFLALAKRMGIEVTN